MWIGFNRVHSVDGLRVVDIPVIPPITVGHFMALAIIFGTKDGRLILEEYRGNIPGRAFDELEIPTRTVAELVFKTAPPKERGLHVRVFHEYTMIPSSTPE